MVKQISVIIIIMFTNQITKRLRHGILIQVKSKTPLGTTYLAAFTFILELTKKSNDKK
jgi:hypothetical protein